MPRSTNSPLDSLADDLAQLEAKHLLRRPERLPEGFRVFCDNDYLGYGALPIGGSSVRSGGSASALVAGHREEHVAACLALSRWLGVHAVTLFASGYAANIGVLQAVAEQGDLIVSDALNHASIVDGCRLSRAEVAVTPHLDLTAIDEALGRSQARRKWVCTEAYFSMDADSPDLPALRRICDAHCAGLIVDEAHSCGLVGPNGQGLCAAQGVVPEVLVGAFGKSFGLHGGFAAGGPVLELALWNRARSFVFSTSGSPVIARAIADRVELIASDADARSRVLAHAERVRRAFPGRIGGWGPILPWLAGSPKEALDLAAGLRQRRIFARAIRPPTVPTSRVRLSVSAGHSAEDVDGLIEALEQVAPRSVGV